MSLTTPEGFRSAAQVLVHGRIHLHIGLRRGDLNQAGLGSGRGVFRKGIRGVARPGSVVADDFQGRDSEGFPGVEVGVPGVEGWDRVGGHITV
jgi:hypothetical protein